MGTKADEFLQQLRATFKVEAAEHLQAIAAGLLELENAPPAEARPRIVEAVFRAAHSLKGAARAVDYAEIESLCQSMEEEFAAWKRQQTAPSRAALDAVHRRLDAVTAAIAEPGAARGGRSPAPAPAEAPAAAAFTPEKALRGEESVRISVARLDARLVEAEEMLGVKLIFGQRVGELGELAQRFEAWRGEWAAIEPQARALRQQIERLAPGGAGQRVESPLARLLDFLDWNHEQLKSVEGRAAALTRRAGQDRHAVGKLVDDLLEDTKKLLLLPFDTISASFPKLVRDLCHEQGKQAEFRIDGERVEIDKRILEEIKDPLIHLLRNCVDHGVEPPGERSRAGKPPRATIRVAVSQISGNKVLLVVSDDGAGIDTAKVKASAVRHGLIAAEEAARLGEAEAQALIFRSELSTSPIITQVSGRGLGLAIVREKTLKLGGEVTVESQPGLGTTFRIVLPTTRATFRGVLVEAAGRLFVLPTSQVERVAQARPDDIRTVEGRETLAFDASAVALVPLADALELPPAERPDAVRTGAPVIVLGSGEQRVAFVVDAVLDEQEVLVKPLAKPLSRVRNVAGATILGSGQVAPILNVADLLKSARRVAARPARPAAGVAPVRAAARTILVVEDSITSRLLLKGILESAGYRVTVAVDGMEAFTLLRAGEFDLVVSDVEMPRLNGFDLTARIRADRKLTELPVVLVTALEKREERERGVDAGANAYLVKSSFDQSNLLEAVRRLI